MTREEAKRLLPIIKAFSEGKTIEVMNTSGHWDEINIPNFDVDPKKYRIKPKPKYRPFKDAEECWQEMQKHQPFGWVKYKEKLYGSTYHSIVGVDNEFAAVKNIDKIKEFSFKFMSNTYIFSDGTPFGILEEE